MHFDVDLNTRQQYVLDNLPEYNSRITVKKTDINMSDLSALTAKTGDEFALFTKGGERLVIRGNHSSVDISPDEARKLNADGYVWSGHTHPGTDKLCLFASDGDRAVLRCFDQTQSSIYNSVGDHLEFEKG